MLQHFYNKKKWLKALEYDLFPRLTCELEGYLFFLCLCTKEEKEVIFCVIFSSCCEENNRKKFRWLTLKKQSRLQDI